MLDLKERLKLTYLFIAHRIALDPTSFDARAPLKEIGASHWAGCIEMAQSTTRIKYIARRFE